MDAAEIARLREGGLGIMSNADLRSLLDALEQARKERDEARELNDKAYVALGITRAQRDQAQEERDGHEWSPPAGDRALTSAEAYDRGKASASGGIARIEELLKIPEDERGFDYGTINRAIEALHEELAQAKDESDERGLDIDILSQMLGEARTQRDQAQKDAKDARALLEDVKWYSSSLPSSLAARIEAMLEKKP